MTSHTRTNHRCAQSRTGRFSYLDLVRHMGAVYLERYSLNRLNSHALRDIGLSRQAAEKEAKRPIWDVLDTWRQ